MPVNFKNTTHRQAPTGETPPLEVSVAVQEPKPGKTPKRGKQPKPEKPTRSAAPGPDGFIPRLKSLYYTRTGNKKEFVSFSQMSVPRFLSVEGDLPAEPPLSHEAKQEEQDLALMMNKRTRKVVAAPSIFEFRTYRYLGLYKYIRSKFSLALGRRLICERDVFVAPILTGAAFPSLNPSIAPASPTVPTLPGTSCGSSCSSP